MKCKCGLDMKYPCFGIWFCECGNAYDSIHDMWVDDDES